jgi:asparagine synthase (glutamine-hydrolysing)
MEAKGHQFKTNCDVEVLVHLYVEYGTGFLNKLNGQFAFAIYDSKLKQLFLGRDQFGICPLYYAMLGDVFVYGSEIKALLAYPGISREINLNGLDQLFTFPANIFPDTCFKHINSLKPGHYLLVSPEKFVMEEYWDLTYPEKGQYPAEKPESYYIDRVEELLRRSVEYRLMADVPVGFYLSGGLDSSLVGAVMKHLRPADNFNSFSICFSGSADNKEINEQRFQQLMSRHIHSEHNEIEFNWNDFDSRLREVIYYGETPLKETYNICSMALSRRAREKNIKVVLSGEGADELFGGYAGYKFDQRKAPVGRQDDLDQIFEDQVRQVLWGNAGFTYEKNEYEFRSTKTALYSGRVNMQYEAFDCLKIAAIDHKKIRNRDIFHQRSYVDFKLRLAGHLIADHGDRMTMANNVEGRFPFLDIELVEFIKTIPPRMMVKDMTEKYILKQIARKYLPAEIIGREKFGFVAPGSPGLLRGKNEWVNDLLSYETIKRQGYFNPDTIERLKKLYARPDYILTPPYDVDLLIIILTFNMFLEVFGVPDLN